MVAPISNDKIMPSDNNSSSVSTKRSANQEASNQKASSSEAISQDNTSVETDSVNVERANQIYNQSTAKPSSDQSLISTYEQAQSLVAEIRSQIEANGQQALKAQTGAISDSLPALLEAAPA